MIRKSLQRFLQEDDGPTAVEYAVMLMLILSTLFVTAQLMGQAVGDNFENSKNQLDAAMD